MPSPVLQDVHVAAALTNIAVAYVQDESHYIAEAVFPMVPVQHQTDKYFVWSKADFFRDEAQKRADAAESAGSGVNLTTQSYAAEVWALHQDIGPQVRSNADPAVEIDVAVTKQLTQKLLIRRDRIFAAAFMTTSVWSQDVTGAAAGTGTVGTTTTVYWDDDAASDPFTDIATQQTYILTNTGFLPNKLVLSWSAYQALRKHPLIIDRIKYTSATFAGTITPQLLAEAFDIEQVVVSNAVYNTSGENAATTTMAMINSKNALLCYTPSAPGLMIPAAGYIFGWQGFTGLNNLGVRVSQIPMNWLGLGTVRTEAEMAFDMQIVGKDLGVYFSGIVSA